MPVAPLKNGDTSIVAPVLKPLFDAKPRLGRLRVEFVKDVSAPIELKFSLLVTVTPEASQEARVLNVVKFKASARPTLPSATALKPNNINTFFRFIVFICYLLKLYLKLHYRQRSNLTKSWTIAWRLTA